MERERLWQIRLSVLEHLADRRLVGGDVDGAIRARTSAVRYGPLRESSQRVLIRTHIVAGNYREAIRPENRALVTRCTTSSTWLIVMI